MTAPQTNLGDADHLLAGQRPAKPYCETQAFKDGVHEGVKRLELFLSSAEGHKGIRLVQLSQSDLLIFDGSSGSYFLDPSARWQCRSLLGGFHLTSAEKLVEDFGLHAGFCPEDIATFVAMRLNYLAAKRGLKS
ncbi:MAG: hypothetical protein HYT48_02315 [Candidatus Vogelbacteria bacterium]|nr:hypothetical protein [Candidatus Vogelbacteria bacterium]